MNDGLKPESRRRILAILSANPRVRKVVIFGSRATGSYRTTSDIDLALFGPDLTLDDHAQLAAQLDELPMAQEVDLVLFNTIEHQALRQHIQQHGVEWEISAPH